MTIRVAAEDLADIGHSTDSGAHLLVLFNSEIVLDISKAELGDVNNLHDISVDVTGKGGTDTVQIVDTGTTTGEGYVGFALDEVSLTTTTITEGHFIF